MTWGGVQVRIISLEPEDTMKVLGVQAVQSSPESLLLLDSPAMGAGATQEGRGVGALFLHIGAVLPFAKSLRTGPAGSTPAPMQPPHLCLGCKSCCFWYLDTGPSCPMPFCTIPCQSSPLLTASEGLSDQL